MQYRGGYHDACGGYLEYLGGCSVPSGYHDKRGGYLEYRGGVFSTVGENLFHDIPHGTQITKDGTPHGTHDIPHGNEYPPWYSRYPPHAS